MQFLPLHANAAVSTEGLGENKFVPLYIFGYINQSSEVRSYSDSDKVKFVVPAFLGSTLDQFKLKPLSFHVEISFEKTPYEASQFIPSYIVGYFKKAKSRGEIHIPFYNYLTVCVILPSSDVCDMNVVQNEPTNVSSVLKKMNFVNHKSKEQDEDKFKLDMALLSPIKETNAYKPNLQDHDHDNKDNKVEGGGDDDNDEDCLSYVKHRIYVQSNRQINQLAEQKIDTCIKELVVDIDANYKAVLSFDALTHILQHSNIETLTFGNNFNASPCQLNLTGTNVKYVKFGSTFNQPVNTWNLDNTNVIEIKFGDSFNQPVDGWDLTKSKVRSVKFGKYFNQKVIPWLWFQDKSISSYHQIPDSIPLSSSQSSKSSQSSSVCIAKKIIQEKEPFECNMMHSTGFAYNPNALEHEHRLNLQDSTRDDEKQCSAIMNLLLSSLQTPYHMSGDSNMDMTDVNEDGVQEEGQEEQMEEEEEENQRNVLIIRSNKQLIKLQNTDNLTITQLIINMATRKGKKKVRYDALTQLLTTNHTIQRLVFGDEFNQEVESLYLKGTNVQHIVFGHSFNQSVQNWNLDGTNVLSIEFGHSFNQPLSSWRLFQSKVQQLTFGESFEHPIYYWLKSRTNIRSIVFHPNYRQKNGGHLKICKEDKSIEFKCPK